MVRVKRVLLDTHALLWALVAPKKLPVTIRKLLENLALVSGDNAFDDLSSPKILW